MEQNRGGQPYSTFTARNTTIYHYIDKPKIICEIEKKGGPDTNCL